MQTTKSLVHRLVSHGTVFDHLYIQFGAELG